MISYSLQSNNVVVVTAKMHLGLELILNKYAHNIILLESIIPTYLQLMEK